MISRGGLLRALKGSPGSSTDVGFKAGLGRSLVVLSVLTVSLLLLLQAVPKLMKASAERPWDGFIDYGGAKEMLAGRDPYSDSSLKRIGLTKQFGLGHPPTTLVWFYPLAHLDLMMMKHVFTWITLIMLTFHLGLVTRELDLPCWPLLSLLTFTFLCQTDWFVLHLAQVDLSELIAFLYLMGWYFLRRGREGPAGVMIGLACTLKLYPGLMVVFLLLARRWRAAVAAGATYLVFVAEVLRQLGPSAFRHFLEQTGSYANLWIANVRNASIDGIVHRWFYPLWRVLPARPLLAKATLIMAVISLVMFVIAHRASRSHLHQALEAPRLIDMPFALFSILSMAPGPYQWEHYNVTLILPLMILLADALSFRRDRGVSEARLVRSGFQLLLLAGVIAMLNVSLVRRNRVPALAQTHHMSVWWMLCWEWTTWLPWFTLATLLTIRLFQLRSFRMYTVRPG